MLSNTRLGCAGSRALRHRPAGNEMRTGPPGEDDWGRLETDPVERGGVAEPAELTLMGRERFAQGGSLFCPRCASASQHHNPRRPAKALIFAPDSR